MAKRGPKGPSISRVYVKNALTEYIDLAIEEKVSPKHTSFRKWLRSKKGLKVSKTTLFRISNEDDPEIMELLNILNDMEEEYIEDSADSGAMNPYWAKYRLSQKPFNRAEISKQEIESKVESTNTNYNIDADIAKFMANATAEEKARAAAGDMTVREQMEIINRAK